MYYKGAISSLTPAAPAASAGASEVLTLLDDRLADAAVVLFDEIVNYPAYREHEVWIETCAVICCPPDVTLHCFSSPSCSQQAQPGSQLLYSACFLSFAGACHVGVAGPQWPDAPGQLAQQWSI